MKFSHLLLAVLLFVISALSCAEEKNSVEEESDEVDCQSCKDSQRWNVGVAIGAGVITNPLAIEDDIYFPLVPRISYYGDKFFLDNLTLGYTAYQSSSLRLYITGKLNSDFLYFEGATDTVKAFAYFSQVTGIRRTDGMDPLLNFGDYHLNDRKASYLLGPELVWQFDETKSLKLDVRKDISRIHYGQEASVEFKYANYIEDWYFEQRFGVTWKSAEVNDYYYGISFEETPTELPTGQTMPDRYRENLTYKANETVTPHLALNVSTAVSENWTFLTSIKVEFLDDAVINSPLVDQDYSISAFVGWGYEF